MLKEHNQQKMNHSLDKEISESLELGNMMPSKNDRSWLERALTIEWAGQTIASICWITSVLLYGLNSAGDWFQLFAASAWLLANISALL